MDIDQKRKRLSFMICICFGIPTITIVGILDYIEGDQAELLIDLMIAIVLVTSPIVLKVYKSDMHVYRMICLILSLIFLWQVLLGTGKGTILYWLYLIPLVLLFFLEKKEGLIWTAIFIGILSCLLFMPSLLHSYEYDFFIAIRFVLSLLTVTFIGYGLESSRFRFGKILECEESMEKPLKMCLPCS
jgi:diguanylate cyclase